MSGRGAAVHAGGSILGLGFTQPVVSPCALYSIKGVHDVVPVEYGQEMFHRSGSSPRMRLASSTARISVS
ncbi:MAG: hypothetical protein JWP25_7381 [Bradyrhizobium sp.]|jgi:hypothetical protein|nr:hypothetical protein [Bradyrhizobium sp.]